jgi:hypothetical protein
MLLSWELSALRSLPLASSLRLLPPYDPLRHHVASILKGDEVM